jgi:hypothetical protein
MTIGIGIETEKREDGKDKYLLVIQQGDNEVRIGLCAHTLNGALISSAPMVVWAQEKTTESVQMMLDCGSDDSTTVSPAPNEAHETAEERRLRARVKELESAVEVLVRIEAQLRNELAADVTWESNDHA